MGDGPFQASAISSDLDLRPDPHKAAHGFVEPARTMKKAGYDQALADTQDQWSIDES